MRAVDFILVAVILAIVGAAAWYIYKAKKNGKKCIGCPNGGSCTGKCSGSSCGCGVGDEMRSYEK